MVPVNMIVYRKYRTHKLFKQLQLRLLISETEFDRSMSRIVKVYKDTKMVVSPNTIREIIESVFQHTAVRTVILNEGLETLRKCKRGRSSHEGAFCST